MGYVADSWIWWVWAALLLFALRHPVICDESELGSTRAKLGWAALLILILSFTPVPVREREQPAGTRGASRVLVVPGRSPCTTDPENEVGQALSLRRPLRPPCSRFAAMCSHAREQFPSS